MRGGGNGGERALIVSSDGHAMAKMPDYRPYLPAEYREAFDDFCKVYADHGYRSFDAENLLGRVDPDVVDEWLETMHQPGRDDGNHDPHRRLQIMEDEGIVAEVLFPDFGLPFELIGSQGTRNKGKRALADYPPRTREQIDVGNKAHNRWVADFCSVAPERFAPMALTLWDDVDAAIAEITWAKSAGFRGVVLPTFDEESPVFHAKFDPIWSTLEDLEMVANTHVAISATVPHKGYQGVPHPAVHMPIHSGVILFRCQEILSHMIWGGVFERHPRLRLCLTEQGSGWVVGALRGWDYSYEGSYLRRDTHEVVRRRPSEYFAEHCYLGSSIFSREEIEARHEIGLAKMLLGMDYPHHEGTFASGGTREYLRATLGAAHVPPEEARLLLGENHVKLWALDREKLQAVADRVAPTLAEVLTPPDTNLFPRGDVNKPLATAAPGG